MSRYALFVCVSVSAVLLSPVHADDKGPVLKKVTFKASELDDFALAQILKLRKVAGSYELHEKTSTIGLRLECYRNGEKVDLEGPGKEMGTGIGGPDPILPT